MPYQFVGHCYTHFPVDVMINGFSLLNWNYKDNSDLSSFIIPDNSIDLIKDEFNLMPDRLRCQNNQESWEKSMPIILQNSFLSSNLSHNADNSNGSNLEAAVAAWQKWQWWQWRGGSGSGGRLVVTRQQRQQHGGGNSVAVVAVWQQQCGSMVAVAAAQRRWWWQ